MAAGIDAELLALLNAVGPAGLAPEAMLVQLPAPGPSRATLNRRLAALLRQGLIRAMGEGRARRYASTSPLSRAEIDAYFERPWQQRPLARFDEALLRAEPALAPELAQRCAAIQALAQPVDRQLLSSFVVDLSWASSLLEGGSYSMLDTEALVRYGQRNADKPGADAVLVLNHKRAAEHLWVHRGLDLANICALQALLTDDHGLAELAGSDHFLAAAQRGRPREYEDVNLAGSAYLPPFRPGTGFVAQALEVVLVTARGLQHPVAAALYLLTRIPYLQAFANGNKRTSRLAANVPLLAQGLLPFSFADVDKADYIRGMAAFYELGSLHVIEQTLVRGYVRSVLRASRIPLELRGRGFDMDAVAKELADFINTGRRPASPAACLFLKA